MIFNFYLGLHHTLDVMFLFLCIFMKKIKFFIFESLDYKNFLINSLTFKSKKFLIYILSSLLDPLKKILVVFKVLFHILLSHQDLGIHKLFIK